MGAVAAIGQINIKRLIAYSSISHIGYALAGLATGSNEGIKKFCHIYNNLYINEFRFIFLFINDEEKQRILRGY